MYTINITTRVDNAIANAWLDWQKEVHIPAYMNTGCFTGHRFLKLLGHDEGDSQLFVLQLMATTQNDLQTFTTKFEQDLKLLAENKWGESITEFRSLLQNID